MIKKSQKIRWAVAIALMIICFATSRCSSQNDPQKVDREVPVAVSDAFETAYPQAVIEEYTEELEDGRASYEITFTENGVESEVVYDEDGTLIALEQIIKISDLPVEIVQAITAAYARFSISKAERIVERSETIYEVEVLNTDDNVVYEHQFLPDGTLMSTEIEDND